MRLNIETLVYNEQGLIPAIVQDVQSKAVLMMAYMNKEALEKTIETQEAWFWSRSRQSLWHKGATSGNIQKVKAIYPDCDRDTLLVLVDPVGPACHRNTYTCFGAVEAEQEAELEAESYISEEANNPLHQGAESGFDYEVLSHLIQVIADREVTRPEGAYTTYLFEKGVDKILKKVGEEASEVIIAAKNRDPEELRNESADLLYHLLVLWREQKLGLDQVIDILKKRHAQ